MKQLPVATGIQIQQMHIFKHTKLDVKKICVLRATTKKTLKSKKM